MKKLAFDYYMQIDYSEEVSSCNFTIKCIPVQNARQFPHAMRIEMYPENKYSIGTDGLFNKTIYGKQSIPHNKFFFRISGMADVGNSDYEELENDDVSMIFRHPHGLNIAGDSIRKYFDSLKLEGFSNDYDKAIYMMDELHKKLEYVPNTTNISTTAEEAFVQGYGVCQDYAHIFIALLHLAGITARYVTGLIVGEGASHAWVEILYDGKWYGLDPTNNKKVLDEHIKLGVGRDAADCMINRGLMRGGGLHTQTVNVKVIEM